MIYKIVSFLVIIIIICYTLEPAVLATDLNHEPKSGVVTSDDTPKNQKVPPVCTDFIPTPKMEIDDPSLNSKNYNKALEESNVALKLFPTNVHVLMKKIIALVGLKEYKNALTCCDQLFKVDSLKGYSARAYVFLSSNDYKNALVNGDEAIKLDKSNVEGWINKVNALIGLKEYKKALDASNEIIKLDKSNINGWINKANALMALHEYDKALDASNEIIKLDKSNINGWIQQSKCIYMV